MSRTHHVTIESHQAPAGSEGTLAVVTEATLRLVSKPAFAVDFLAPFRLFDDAVSTVSYGINDHNHIVGSNGKR